MTVAQSHAALRLREIGLLRAITRTTLIYVRVGLFDCQNPVHSDQGKITGADGQAYSRQGTKASRKLGDELVAAGVPLIVYMYSRDQFEWIDGEDAKRVWSDVRSHVSTTEPTSKQLSKHVVWTAGVWTSDEDDQVLYLTGHC